jgi:hypothetical protein
MQVNLPTNEKTNKAVMDSNAVKQLKQYIDGLKPEAAYFTTGDEGERAFFLIIDMADPSRIPVISEPLYQMFGARVRFRPVMNWADVEKGATEAAQNMPR